MGVVIYDWGNVADWLVAVGTVGAVIVSLYLAANGNRPKVKITKEGDTNFILTNKKIVSVGIKEKGFFIHKTFWRFKKKKYIIKKRADEYIQQAEYSTVYESVRDFNIRLIRMGYKSGEKLKIIAYFKSTLGKTYTKTFTHTPFNEDVMELLHQQQMAKIAKATEGLSD